MDLLATGKRIKEVRMEQHLTQETLSEMADITPHYLYEIERGNKTMSIYTLVAVADALNVSIDYLMYGSGGRDHAPVDYVKDELDTLIESVPTQKRHVVCDMLNATLPYLK